MIRSHRLYAWQFRRQGRIVVTLITAAGSSAYAKLGVVQISIDIAVKAVFIRFLVTVGRNVVIDILPQ